ncbi:alpha-glucosidase [Microbacterium sp. BK668]|uniref:alpha-glucosidase n=1 Tax=Microbacterium sp. BK668 TaxID=2512118 RepID=UPI00105F056F|nr:alpha-glucosidase [Microbacterium sp. BK668]TDN91579.1 oligo-1,6-glucosidase [Microbacterium sp. BK668]
MAGQETPKRGEGQEWWRTGTVYQVYPRSFADSDGDGVGDLRGVLAHVDHLAWLGVDAVWLSPFYPSPQKDNGYDISDYEDVDSIFGSLEDLDELIVALHARGIRLILDLVVNHTSDQHPWFVSSRSSKEDPRREWYVWRDARNGVHPGGLGAEPTNWESFFSQPAWTFDERTGQYYLHLFAVEQPDLNWENREVRRAVYAMMNRWLDRGVDGFRMDVINLISKRLPLEDGPLLPSGVRGDGSAWYNFGPRLEEFLQEMHREVFAGREGKPVRIGETPGVTVEQAIRLSDPSRRELDMVFQFEHVDLDRDPHDWQKRLPLDRRALYENLAGWQRGLAESGWNSLYLSNHDQPRPVSRYGDDSAEHRAASAKTLWTMLYLMKGTAFLYQGDEIGMANYPFTSLSDFVDVSARNYIHDELGRGADPARLLADLRVTSRDNARTPVQWDGSRGGGFTIGDPWFPLNPDRTEVSVAAQRDDESSVLHYVRQLIAARKSHPALVLGDFHDLATPPGALIAYERRSGDHLVRVVANLGSEAVRADVAERPSWAADEPLLSVRVENFGDRELAPWASFVWATEVTS